MKIDHTNRGFTLIEFKDRNDIECSLQKSSSAMEESIWLGCNDPEPKYQIPGIPGWQRIILPEFLIRECIFPGIRLRD